MTSVVFVFTTLEVCFSLLPLAVLIPMRPVHIQPFLKPLMKQATAGLQAASGEVINKHDQYEVRLC